MRWVKVTRNNTECNKNGERVRVEIEKGGNIIMVKIEKRQKKEKENR
jgi:hypothetical protein